MLIKEKLIVNSSFLIAIYSELERADLIDKLIEMNFKLLAPKGVLEELRDGKAFPKIISDVSLGKIEILEATPEGELQGFMRKYPSLHRGEIEVIDWGLKSRGETKCLLDDGKARKVAKLLGLDMIGTLGVLKLLKEAGKISQKEFFDLLRRLKEKGFRLPEVINNNEMEGI